MLIFASILLLHLFVYALGFRGEDRRRASGGFVRTFGAYTLPGYALVLRDRRFLALTALLMLFGRTS